MSWPEISFVALGYIGAAGYFFLGGHLLRKGEFGYIGCDPFGRDRRCYRVRGVPALLCGVLCLLPLPLVLLGLMVQGGWWVTTGHSIIPQVNALALVGVASAVVLGGIAVCCQMIAWLFRDR